MGSRASASLQDNFEILVLSSEEQRKEKMGSVRIVGVVGAKWRKWEDQHRKGRGVIRNLPQT